LPPPSSLYPRVRASPTPAVSSSTASSPPRFSAPTVVTLSARVPEATSSRRSAPSLHRLRRLQGRAFHLPPLGARLERIPTRLGLRHQLPCPRPVPIIIASDCVARLLQRAPLLRLCKSATSASRPSSSAPATAPSTLRARVLRVHACLMQCLVSRQRLSPTAPVCATSTLPSPTSTCARVRHVLRAARLP
jgi:hypothetical protein